MLSCSEMRTVAPSVRHVIPPRPRSQKKDSPLNPHQLLSLSYDISLNAYDLSYVLCLISYRLLYTFISCLVVCCKAYDSVTLTG